MRASPARSVASLSCVPYALKTQQVLSEVTAESRRLNTAAESDEESDGDDSFVAGGASTALKHPLLQMRAERHVLFVVLTSDRGLCGSFNASICKRAEREWRHA